MAFIPTNPFISRPCRPRPCITMRANVPHTLYALALTAGLVLTPIAPILAHPTATQRTTTLERSVTSSTKLALVPNTTSATDIPTVSRNEEATTLTHEATQHKPLAQRLSHYFQSHNLPPPLIVYILSALPLVELRAGIPVGFLLSQPPLTIFILAVIGNLTPIIPLLLLLRLPFVQTVAARFLNRAREKARRIGSAQSRTLALMLFVGIPLPGTGAWTGCVVAFVLGMSLIEAFVALGGGVVMAACVMMLVCGLGVWGWVFGGSALLAVGVGGMLGQGHKESEEVES